MKTEIKGGLLGLAALAVFSIILVVYVFSIEEPYSFSELRCAIATGKIPPSEGLVAGYNYDLLSKFASDNEAEVDIISVGRDTSCLDSLRYGILDIVVIRSDYPVSDDSLRVYQIDSISSWVIKHSAPGRTRAIEQWLESYLFSPEDSLEREMYFFDYNPRRSGRRSARTGILSPYDDLIKAEAERIGWDWRMLAALIYQESRFDINARSHRGALGLMQLMPGTAKHMGVDDLIHPETSIKAGADYLRSLQRMFRKYAANSDELHKFTLASYNAGQGRILQCIQFCEQQGREFDTWNSIVAAIPDIEDFKGTETIAYVEQVYSLYSLFCRIAPK